MTDRVMVEWEGGILAVLYVFQRQTASTSIVSVVFNYIHTLYLYKISIFALRFLFFTSFGL